MVRPLSTILSITLLLCTGLAASAQTVFQWTDTTSDWSQATAWSVLSGPGTAPPNATNHTANFANQASINFQPDIAAVNYQLLRLSMDNTGADWNLNGSGTISLFSTSTTNTTAAIQVVGPNTVSTYTTIAPNLQLGASNFWYAGTNAAVNFTGNISSANTTSTLNLRPEIGSTIRLSGNNTLAVASGNAATIGSGGGSSGTARIEINTDQPFGTGNLSFGGGGLSLTLSAINAPRTITNNATYAVNWIVDGSQNLIFSGTVNNANSSARTITSNTTGGAALIFNGNSALSAGTVQTTTWQGTGRIEHNGVMSDGGAGAVTLALNGTASSFTVRLTGANTFTGNTQLIQGTLILGGNAPNAAAGTLGNSSLTVSVGNLGAASTTAILLDGPYTVGRSFNLRSGTSTFTQGITTMGGTTADVSAFNGQISIGTASNANNKTLIVTAATGGTVNIGGNITLFSGYTGVGDVVKNGPGTVALNGGFNSYNGTTTVNAGTLLVNGSLLTGGADVNVNANATLGGSGSIARNVNLASTATLAPGNSPGILTVTGNVSFSTGSNFAVELNGPNAGTDYDRLVLSSTSTLALNNANLNLSLGFIPTAFQPFIIVTGLTSPATGIFNSLPDGSFFDVGGNTFQISYSGDLNTNQFSGAGNDIVIQAVPEPATIAMLSGTLLASGVALWRYRRRQSMMLDAKLR